MPTIAPWLQPADTLGSIRSGAALGMQLRQQAEEERRAAEQMALAQAKMAHDQESAARQLQLSQDRLFLDNQRENAQIAAERENAAARLRQAEAQSLLMGRRYDSQDAIARDRNEIMRKNSDRAANQGGMLNELRSAAQDLREKSFQHQQEKDAFNRKATTDDTRDLVFGELSLLGVAPLEIAAKKNPNLFGPMFGTKNFAEGLGVPKALNPSGGDVSDVHQLFETLRTERGFSRGGKSLTQAEINAVLQELGSPSRVDFPRRIETFRQKNAAHLINKVDALRRQGFDKQGGRYAKQLDYLDGLAKNALKGPLSQEQIDSMVSPDTEPESTESVAKPAKVPQSKWDAMTPAQKAKAIELFK